LRQPLRKIREVVNGALASVDAEFQALYTDFGRPSSAPERLIRGEPAPDPVLGPVRAAIFGADAV
jgi:hypothetical protein